MWLIPVVFQILRQKPTKYQSNLKYILFKYKPLQVSANQIGPSEENKFTAAKLLKPQFLQYLILWVNVKIYKSLHVNIYIYIYIR